MNNDSTVMDLVIATIRRVINEEWIHDFEMDAETRFNDDLELESIEFVKIANALQQHYGNQINIATWLSGKSIHELINLNIGTLTDYIQSALQTAQG